MVRRCRNASLSAANRAQFAAKNSDEVLAGALSDYLSLDRTMAFDAAVEDQVRKLTPAQVNEAMREFIKPADISFVTAGDFAKAEKEASGVK